MPFPIALIPWNIKPGVGSYHHHTQILHHPLQLEVQRWSCYFDWLLSSLLCHHRRPWTNEALIGALTFHRHVHPIVLPIRVMMSLQWMLMIQLTIRPMVQRRGRHQRKEHSRGGRQQRWMRLRTSCRHYYRSTMMHTEMWWHADERSRHWQTMRSRTR